jgi:hypothetical protein
MPDITNPDKIKSLLHPIIYVRGYAMTENERDETAADPFCGFNLGSTVYRANIEKEEPANKFIFESPMLRLMSDFKYTDTYENGLDFMDKGWKTPIPYRSVIVYRYYDKGSRFFGDGRPSPIEDYATGLKELIVKVRDLVIDEQGNGIKDFKCYLVAHSMGGLICRAFLQNPKLSDLTVRSWVDKVFTYATPHNGIEMGGINIPSWLSMNDMDNFSRERISNYLALEEDPNYQAFKNEHDEKKKHVNFINNFNPERFFCMVGTNRADYKVAMGLSRTFAGDGSDGLVKIDNAVLYGKNAQLETIACPRAYAYRSHSGFFGIVNSEEAFQNLTRFLFGSLRVDIWFDVDIVTLPTSLQNLPNVEAAYHFEIMSGPKGKPWNFTRRIAVEDSVAVRTHKELGDNSKKKIYLSTIFLAKWAKVDEDEATRNQLSYSVTFNVGVQEYLKEGVLFNSHYEGLKLFTETLIIDVDPDKGGNWHWAQDSEEGEISVDKLKDLTAGKVVSLLIPIPSVAGKTPGITGSLRLILTPWNN